MAGVLGHLVRPQKRAVEQCTFQVDETALELEAAKEILAEVFSVRLSDVDEMILSRFEAADNGDTDNEDIGSEELWQQEFRLGE